MGRFPFFSGQILVTDKEVVGDFPYFIKILGKRLSVKENRVSCTFKQVQLALHPMMLQCVLKSLCYAYGHIMVLGP